MKKDKNKENKKRRRKKEIKSAWYRLSICYLAIALIHLGNADVREKVRITQPLLGSSLTAYPMFRRPSPLSPCSLAWLEKDLLP